MSSVGTGAISGSAGMGAVGAPTSADPVSSGAVGGGVTGASAVGGLGAAGQPAAPSVSADAEVSDAVGQQGSTVLRGGAQGVVENQVPGGGSVGAGQDTVAQVRAGQSTVSDAHYAVGEAVGSPTSAAESGFDRGGSLEFSQRDQAVAQARSVEDAHDEAHRIVDDPQAAGTERAELEGASAVGGALPVDPGRAQAQANLATGAVADPQGTARSQAEEALAAQERGAEVKVGVSGTAGTAGATGTAGTPPDGSEKK